jgi:hypothetical protein
MTPQPSPNLKHKASKHYDAFSIAVAFALVVGGLWLILPVWLAPIGCGVGALVFFLIYDTLRSASPRNAQALQRDKPWVEKLGWTLCACNLVWPVIYFFLVYKVYAPPIYSGRKIISFLRSDAEIVGLWLIPAFTVALFILLLWTWWKKVQQKQQIAIAFVIVMMSYPTGLVTSGIALFAMGDESGAGKWHLRQKIRGNDNRTYYLLHAPPPFNGPGHNVIARQMKHSPISVTMQIVTPDYGSGDLASILTAGSEDKNPRVRELCKMLLQSKKGWGKVKY